MDDSIPRIAALLKQLPQNVDLTLLPQLRDQCLRLAKECSRALQGSSRRDIFALPGELSRAILEGVAINAEGNASLNRMALVGRLWHNMLAPLAGACIPALTRRVTLSGPDLLQNVRSWWRSVKVRSDATDTGLASLTAGCAAITNLDLSKCDQITDKGLASVAAGCTVMTCLNLSYCDKITDAGVASLIAGCTSITDLNLSYCDKITDAGLSIVTFPEGCFVGLCGFANSDDDSDE